MPSNKFVPTPEALAVARELAQAMGDTFDEARTSQTALNLLEIYFNDIAAVLPVETAGIRFEHFATRDFAAFIRQGREHPTIRIDQQLDCFLFSAFFSNTLLSCHVFEPGEQERVTSFFNQSLLTYRKPYHHEVLRQQQKPYILAYRKEAELANALVIATVGFILCHEIGHHQLGHFEREQTLELEYEADALGFQLLTRLAQHQDVLPHVKIAANKFGAPILSLTYLAAATDDPALKAALLDRAGRLRKMLEAQPCNDDAFYLLDGFLAGIPAQT